MTSGVKPPGSENPTPPSRPRRRERIDVAVTALLAGISLLGLLGLVPMLIAAAACASLLTAALVRLAITALADLNFGTGGPRKRFATLTRNQTFAQVIGALIVGTFTLVAASSVQRQTPVAIVPPSSISPTQSASANGPISPGSPATSATAGDTSLSPSPSPETPVIGTVTLLGRVPTHLPGLLVASGAAVTSDLDLQLRPCAYYAIGLRLGESLIVTIDRNQFYQEVQIAYPGKGYSGTDWSTLYGSWQASTDGVVPVRVCDYTQGSGAYTYTVRFVVTPAPS
jgi:hypothetical protein